MTPTTLNTLICLAAWTIAIMAFHQWYLKGEAVREHFGTYPMGHFILGFVACAPIFFLLGWWMAMSSV